MQITDKKRIEILAERVSAANDAYYNKDPIMSDEEFDALKDELKDLDPENSLLFAVGASPQDSHWEKMKHQIPMGSQDKVNTIEELIKWSKMRGVNNDKLCVQEKLDGISLSLNYQDGKLKSAVTRGDGVVGEDIYRNALKMKGVQKIVPDDFNGSIRGEIILLKSDWQKHLPELANPRNAAAGISRRMTEGGQEHLTVVCYDLVTDDFSCSTEDEKIKKIKNLGFNVPNLFLCNAKEVEKTYKAYEDGERAALDYEIDGFVIKVNSIKDQLALGNAGGDATGNPKGQIALKFAHEMRESEILNVTWEVGLTGRVTPLAWITPVKVAGAMISRASLHNISNVKKLNAQIGSKVLVSRRNDVIPYIEKSLSKGTIDIVTPKNCPKCQGQLEINGEYLQCNSDECRIAGNLEKWINVSEIENVGPRIVEVLVEQKLIAKPGDLYRLTTKMLSNLDRMGDKSAERIVSNIQSKKSVPLHVFFAGLNIPSCGERVFKSIIEGGFDTIDKIRQIKVRQIESLNGFGSIQANAVVSGLHKKSDTIDDLLDAGVSIAKNNTVGNKLTGKSFCFTGSMERPRGDLEKMVLSNGGQIKSVSKDLTYLVIADLGSTSSKAAKARQCGVKLIQEDEFMRMV